MPDHDSFVSPEDEAGLTIVVDMKRFKIDAAAGEITVEELAESLKRAGIERIRCSRASGQRIENGMTERLIYRGILPDREGHQE